MSEAHEPSVSEPVDGETVDLSDERDVRRLARDAKAKENIQATVLRNLMASIDGREWIFKLLTICHVYRASYVPGRDALEMAHREGERNIGVQLVGQIQIFCPEQYLAMMKEAKDRGDDV